MYDPRLLGSWRSDPARTWRELAARRDIPSKNKRGLRRLFGKLELRFTRTTRYLTLDEHTEAVPYTVVAKDASSAAIVMNDPLFREQVISHVHYEGRHFWVAVGSGLFREFFKRIETRSARPGRAKHRRSTR